MTAPPRRIQLFSGGCTKLAMARQGLCLRPPLQFHDLSEKACALRDELSAALDLKLLTGAQIRDGLIEMTAKEFGAHWPMPNPKKTNFLKRDPLGLDVPALWAVRQYAHRWWDDAFDLARKSQHDDARRAFRASSSAFDLVNALSAIIGDPYQVAGFDGWSATGWRRPERAWTLFEIAFASWRPIVFMPVIAIPESILAACPETLADMQRGPRLVHDNARSAI